MPYPACPHTLPRVALPHVCSVRNVRVNVESIKRVLSDPERSATLTFTRPLPLPQMVDIIAEHWDNEGVEEL